MPNEEFAEAFRQRTKKFTVSVILFCKALRKDFIDELLIRQLVRSASSVGANYRAACRARSKAEFFAKISIVVEEADETYFW